MIHVMLPVQYLRRAGARLAEPEKRLALAVLQTVVYDCGVAHDRAGRGRRPGAGSPGVQAGYGLRRELRPELAVQLREPVRHDPVWTRATCAGGSSGRWVRRRDGLGGR